MPNQALDGLSIQIDDLEEQIKELKKSLEEVRNRQQSPNFVLNQGQITSGFIQERHLVADTVYALGDMFYGDGTRLKKLSPGPDGYTLVLSSGEPVWAKIRTNTVVSNATPSINTDTTDIFTITALATAITSFTTNLTGTPVNGQKLTIRIKDDGTARAITWGASFASRGATLPTTTVLGKYQYNGFIYNSTTSTWDCVSSVNET